MVEHLMSSTMKKLPLSTARLLSGTQVITSISSIVKELIENSLDAGATVIDIKLENSGFDKIEVQDNGDGIKCADVPFVAQPHYTSKISTFSDLLNLITYGFRGEALGALCAVSDVTIRTKTKEEEISMVYTFDHSGKIVSSKPSPLGQGTTVTASKVFKNIPVRKQYYGSYKRKKEEIKKIEDLLIAFASVQPGVRFALYHNHNQIWQKIAVPDVRSALLQSFGHNVINIMEYVTRTDHKNEMTVEAFFPKPNSSLSLCTRSTNDRFIVSVNKRPVQMNEIEKLVQQYFFNLSDGNKRYPICYISLTSPPVGLDVNLEPNKTKVAFQESEAMLNLVSSALESVYGSQEKSDSSTQLSKENCIMPAAFSDKCNNYSLADENTSSDKTEATQQVVVSNISKNRENSSDLLLSSKNNDCNAKFLFRNVSCNETNFLHSNVVNHSTEVKDNLEHTNKMINDCSIAINNNTEGQKQIACSSLNQEVSNNFLDISEELISGLGIVPSSKKLMIPDNSEVIEIQASCHNHNTSDRPLTQKDTEKSNVTVNCVDNNKAIHFKTFVSDNCGKNTSVHSNSSLDNSSKEVCSGISNCLNDVESDIKESSPVLRDKNSSDWCHGIIQAGNGEIIQPVQVLASNNKKHHLLKIPSPKKKKKKLEDKHGQTTMYDMLGKHLIRRPLSAFEYYCKEEKSEVISKNPEINNDDVTKFLTEHWHQLPEERKKSYKDLAEKDVERFKKQINLREKRDSDNDTREKMAPKLSVKKKSSNKSKPDYKKYRQTHTIKFDLEDLKCLSSYTTQFTQTVTDSNDYNLIGQLVPSGAWICYHDNQILIVNHFRIQETVLFHRLLATHHLEMEKLDLPNTLNESSFGNSLLWHTLLSLKTTRSSLNSYYSITDERLTANGFDVRISEGYSGLQKAEIVRMAKGLSFYGINDLIEILKIIAEENLMPLNKCRPIKVVHYLRGEAVRMARQCPSKQQKEDMEEIFKHMDTTIPQNCTECFHRRPFFHVLYNLDNYMSSQSQF